MYLYRMCCGTCTGGCKPIMIRTVPYLIENSGNYKLAHSFTASSGSAGITIAANNVNLDLCGQVLSGPGQTGSTGSPFIDGILLNSGVNNIQIFNGTIRQFNGYGINATVVNTLKLHDLLVEENGNPLIVFKNGISIIGTSENFSDNIVIERVICKQNAFIGCNIENARNIYVVDSNFVEGLQGYLVIPPFNLYLLVSGGFACTSLNGWIENLLMERCKFNNQYAQALEINNIIHNAYTIGVSIANPLSKNIKLIDCDASNNNTDANGLTGAHQANGFSLQTNNNITFVRCTSNNNVMTNAVLNHGTSSGWSLFGSNNITLENCQSDSHSGGGEFTAGVRINACNDVLITNTTANHNNSSVGPVFGFQTHHQVSEAPYNNRYRFINCEASNNLSNGNTGYGWQLSGVTGGFLDNCVAANNTSVGIYVVDNNENNVNFGASSVIVKDSKVTNNGQYGIRDISSGATNGTNAYIDNVGISNLTANFSVGGAYVQNNVSLP